MGESTWELIALGGGRHDDRRLSVRDEEGLLARRRNEGME